MVGMKLQFTIRDLLLLIIIVALAMGWWFDSRGRIRQHDADRNQINECNNRLRQVEFRLKELSRKLN
jgi:hypothetical protein